MPVKPACIWHSATPGSNFLFYPRRIVVREGQVEASENIPEVWPVVLHGHAFRLALRPLVYRAVLAVEPTILPHEEDALGEGEKGREKHKGGTNAHALDIPWLIFFGEDVGAQERSTLANEIDEDD